jgi:hypothetical protein
LGFVNALNLIKISYCISASYLGFGPKISIWTILFLVLYVTVSILYSQYDNGLPVKPGEGRGA